MIIIPLLFTILYLYKYIEAIKYPQRITYDLSEYTNTLPKSEFVENQQPPVGSFTDGGYLTSVAKNIMKQGFMPATLETSFYSYFIFSFYLSWSIVSTIGLLYYRKFKSQ